MSISDKKLRNPAKKFIEFQSEKKQFTYYDKEKKKDVPIKLPFLFAVLDVTSSITGFNKDSKSGIYSNEIHSSVHEILHVRTFKGNNHVVGLWKEKKEEIGSLGGDFTNNIYALHVDKDPEGKRVYELVHIRLKRSALGEWVHFKYIDDQHVVGIMNEFKEEKNGAVTYNVPVFKRFNIDADILKEAERVDIEILKPYFAAKKRAATMGDAVEENVVEDTPDVGVESNEGANPVSVINDAPVNTSQIPEPDDDLPF
jgi:hypothetical protein